MNKVIVAGKIQGHIFLWFLFLGGHPNSLAFKFMKCHKDFLNYKKKLAEYLVALSSSKSGTFWVQ